MRIDVLFGSALITPGVVSGRVVAVIDVLFTTVTPVAAVPPRLTVAPVKKPVPVIVMAVPPAVLPEAGAMPVTVGAGFETPPPARKAATCITQLEDVAGAMAV